MPTKLPCMFPRRQSRPDQYWLYAIGTASGITKVGMTMDPHGRMYAHRSNLGKFEWVHLFSSLPRGIAYQAESAVLPMLAQVGQRIGRTETFTGITREKTISVMRQAIADAAELRLRLRIFDAQRRAEAAAVAHFRKFELPKLLGQQSLPTAEAS